MCIAKIECVIINWSDICIALLRYLNHVSTFSIPMVKSINCFKLKIVLDF